MALDRNELAAFADGELPEARAAEVAALVEADPALAGQVAAHHSLKARLAAHYAPLLDAPVPEQLTAMLAPTNPKVIEFAAERAKRRLPRWALVAGPALAATLALALILPRGEDVAPGYADAQLASVLDSRLVSEQSPAAETRVLLSFEDGAGRYCRAFSGGEASGIACRDDTGWKLETLGTGGKAASADYRQAGASEVDLMARAQAMAAGPALDEDEEAQARSAGWHVR